MNERKTRPHSLHLALLSTMLAVATACGNTTTIGSRQIKPTAADVDFGDVQITRVSKRNLVIKNEGEAAFTIVSVKPLEGDAARYFQFDVNALKNITVAPASERKLSVSFSPEAVQSYEATVEITIARSDKPLTVKLKGQGVTSALTILPPEVDFKFVKINTMDERQIKLTNNSDVDAAVTLVAGDQSVLCSEQDPGAPQPFCVEANLTDKHSLHLAAGQSTTLLARFKPDSPVEYYGSFDVQVCDDQACLSTITFKGTGVESGLACLPAKLAFGAVNPNQNLTLPVRCKNIANESIAIQSWRLNERSTSKAFTIEQSRSFAINPGDQAEIAVTYSPTSISNDTGELIIENSDAEVRIPIVGSGGGPDIQVFPNQLNFGLVATIAPALRTVTIQNLGLEALNIQSLSLDNPVFSVTAGDSRDPLEPGESRELTVQFQPTEKGKLRAQLTIHSNDADEPEKTIRLTGEGVELPPCQFTVEPSTLNFGGVTIGRTGNRGVNIRNTATKVDGQEQRCLVTSARIAPGSPSEFKLTGGEIVSKFIDPGASLTIPASFTPTGARTFTGALEFSISSDTRPNNTIPMNGEGADATLLISPDQLLFGTMGIGCSSNQRNVSVYNMGSQPALINSITVVPADTKEHPNFQLFNLPDPNTAGAWPISIPSGQSINFGVTFRADKESDFTAAVEIVGSFEGQPATYVVDLRGRGSQDASQTQRFTQLAVPRVDVLFVVDHTGSMTEEQQALASNFKTFVRFAEAQRLDYQLGITTTDVEGGQEQGRLCPTAGTQDQRIVTPKTRPSPEQQFVSNVTCRPLSGGGAENESGLKASELALSPPVSIGSNAGFLRNDAVLAVVYMSDEHDQSPGNVSYYLAFLRSIKGFARPELFTASAIVGPEKTGCTGPGGDGEASPRYHAVQRATGGVYSSICDADWSVGLEKLARSAFGFKAAFTLQAQPVEATIVVMVNGKEVPRQDPTTHAVSWSYDSSSGSVVFKPAAVPEPGAEILIHYAALCR